MTAELAMVGSQCRGERHEQVIARQRDALVELRAKMRVMESGHNPRTYTLSHIFIVVFHFIDHFRDEPGLTGSPWFFPPLVVEEVSVSTLGKEEYRYVFPIFYLVCAHWEIPLNI